MEKKTTQRMIGILVVAALIVILLPLIFNGSATQATTQTAEVKAPPFPDQAAQTAPLNQASNDATASSNITISQDTANTINTNVTATTDSENNVVLKAAPTTTASNAPVVIVNDQPVTTQTTAPTPAAPAPVVSAASATPPVISATTPAPTLANTATSSTPAQLEEDQLPEATAAPTIAEPKQIKKITTASKHTASHQDLVNLKNPAWAVQMGSFKVKINAERLANRLRAQGYKAFTREVRSSTRVYVGPEFKQTAAVSLAQKLEQNLNMHGLVVAYHPLEL
jgi:cell division septation protein DedD